MRQRKLVQDPSEEVLQNIGIRWTHRAPNHAHLSQLDSYDPADDACSAPSPEDARIPDTSEGKGNHSEAREGEEGPHEEEQVRHPSPSPPFGGCALEQEVFKV